MAYELPIDPTLYERALRIAERDGLAVDAVLSRAVSSGLADAEIPEQELMHHLEASLRENDNLYRKLAQ